MQKGERLALPGGVEFRLIAPARETDGERVEFEIALEPGAPSPPKHLHPDQREEWHVVEGEIEVWLDGRWRTLRAGESATVPAGEVHTFRNRSAATARVRDVHLPARDFEQYVQDLHRAIGGRGRRGPATLAALAAVLVDHRASQVSASRLQRLGESLLAAVGRRRRG